MRHDFVPMSLLWLKVARVAAVPGLSHQGQQIAAAVQSGEMVSLVTRRGGAAIEQISED